MLRRHAWRPAALMLLLGLSYSSPAHADGAAWAAGQLWDEWIRPWIQADGETRPSPARPMPARVTPADVLAADPAPVPPLPVSTMPVSTMPNTLIPGPAEETSRPVRPMAAFNAVVPRVRRVPDPQHQVASWTAVDPTPMTASTTEPQPPLPPSVEALPGPAERFQIAIHPHEIHQAQPDLIWEPWAPPYPRSAQHVQFPESPQPPAVSLRPVIECAATEDVPAPQPRRSGPRPSARGLVEAHTHGPAEDTAVVLLDLIDRLGSMVDGTVFANPNVEIHVDLSMHGTPAAATSHRQALAEVIRKLEAADQAASSGPCWHPAPGCGAVVYQAGQAPPRPHSHHDLACESTRSQIYYAPSESSTACPNTTGPAVPGSDLTILLGPKPEKVEHDGVFSDASRPGTIPAQQVSERTVPTTPLPPPFPNATTSPETSAYPSTEPVGAPAYPPPPVFAPAPPAPYCPTGTAYSAYTVHDSAACLPPQVAAFPVQFPMVVPSNAVPLTLRDTSRQLELLAHQLECLDQYDRADELRTMAGTLRRDARALSGGVVQAKDSAACACPNGCKCCEPKPTTTTTNHAAPQHPHVRRLLTDRGTAHSLRGEIFSYEIAPGCVISASVGTACGGASCAASCTTSSCATSACPTNGCVVNGCAANSCAVNSCAANSCAAACTGEKCNPNCCATSAGPANGCATNGCATNCPASSAPAASVPAASVPATRCPGQGHSMEELDCDDPGAVPASAPTGRIATRPIRKPLPRPEPQIGSRRGLREF